MKNLLSKLNTLKADKKLLNETLKSYLLDDPDYLEVYEERKQTNELLRLNKKRLIETSPIIAKSVNDINNKQAEIKLIKDALNDSIIITNKDNGEQLSLNLF